MATLNFLIGIPGSGKSTFARKLVKERGYVIVSSDKVRDNRPDLTEKQIFPEVYRLIAEYLKQDKDVIIDATNISSGVRNHACEKISEYNVSFDKVAYIFLLDAQSAVERVKKRNLDPNERYLPLEVPAKYVDKLELPLEEENFKEIIYVNQEGVKIKDHIIKACIFDLDGTLLDSTLVWKDVDINFFTRRGLEVPPNYGKDISTMGLDEAAVYTKKTYNIKETPEEIKKEWLDAVLHKYVYEVPLKPHAKELLDYLKSKNVHLAVATANSKECYEPCLTRNEIINDFSYVEDVRKFKNGKRSPEIFLHVQELLKCNIDEVMIFEDTLTAIQTAKSAGFKVCAIFDEACSEEDEREKKKIADIYINDFSEVLN